MFSAECKVEKRNFYIDIPLTYEFKLRTLNERFLLTEIDKKGKQNTARRRKKVHEHGMRKGHKSI